MLVLMLGSVGITKGFAYDFSATYGGKTLYYRIIDAENHYVELTCPGTQGYNSWDGYTKPTGTLSLPSNVSYNNTTYSVNRIGWYAFSGCTGLTSINLSSSITSIGGSAFWGCNGLTGTLIIGNNVSAIYESAFLGCSNITAVVLGENVTIVSSRAFDGCANLTEITIGEGVTQIYDGAFGDCPLLTTVHFNATNCTRMYSGDPEEEWDDVYSVFSTFNGETPAISTLTIGENVQNIPDFAFKDCLNLTTVTIPNSVTTIGGCAFYNCTGLTSFTLGTSLDVIYSWAFRNCSNVSSISIFDTTPADVYSDAFSGIGTGIPVYVPCGTTQMYSNGSNLQWAWRRFTNYQEQNWHNLVVTSNDNYKGTVEITQNATCSDNAIVTAIPNAGVFQNWTEGGEVVSTDNPYSFELTSDRNLVANFVPVEIIEGDYKYTVDLVTGEASVKANNTSVTSSLFATSVEYQNVGYPVTSIAQSGFSDCTNITEMIIPNSIITIERGAFTRCRFTKVVIPSSVTTIGQQAFFNCISLNEVVFEDGPELITLYNNKYSDGIGGGLFENCPVEKAYIGRNIAVSNYNDSYNRPWTNAPFSRWWDSNYAPLSEVTIASCVTQLCDYFFEKCNAIEFIVSEIESPDNMTIGTGVFRHVDKTIPIYVPCGSVASYQNTTGWSEFTNYHTDCDDPIIFADANVKAICVENWDTNDDGELSYAEAAAVTDLGEVFKNNTTITSFDELQYFTGLTAIGDFAFQRCLGLISIVIPNSVISIGNSAFSDCTSLTSIIIPDSVTSIGICAFLSCYVLPSIEIHHSITSIGSGAFGECEALTSIVIPNSVTSIGSEVLAGCSNLTQIVVEEGNTVYDSRDNCNAIIETATNCLIAGCKNTIIPNSVTSIGNYAFRYCYGLNSIEIPNSVTDIGEQAFAYCPDLTTVLIGDSVTTIMWGAFLNCDALTSIEIPNSVTSIGSNVFWNCDALSQIIVEDGNPVYDSRDNCNAIIKTATNSLIAGCQSTVIPNSVISIGFDAFNYCSSLTAITIPSSVISIGNYAFYYCSGLTSITVMSDTPPEFVLNNVTNGVFEGVDKSIPVYVPCNSMSAYQNADGWNEFTNYIEMCTEITQTINLLEGWNWISINLAIEDQDAAVAMLDQLKEQLGENAEQIQSFDYTTEYQGDLEWFGDLDEIGVYNEQTYMIQAVAACEVVLTGTAKAEVEDYTIEINPGWNWIGFPNGEAVSVEDAMADFEAEEEDQIQSKYYVTEYTGDEWFGDLETFVPGEGYMYLSMSDTVKYLVLKTGTKKRRGK